MHLSVLLCRYVCVFTAKVAGKLTSCSIPVVSTESAFLEYISNFLQRIECCVNLITLEPLRQICDKCSVSTSGESLIFESCNYMYLVSYRSTCIVFIISCTPAYTVPITMYTLVPSWHHSITLAVRLSTGRVLSNAGMKLNYF